MLCKFCHREFEDGLSECPYCHYVVDVEAQTLTKDERDTFSGVTIEQDGTVRETSRPQEADQDDAENYADNEQETPHSQGIHVFHMGSSILWLGLILLFILGLILTFLPAFIVIAAIISLGVFVGRIFFS
jgi:hypothetical protein